MTALNDNLTAEIIDFTELPAIECPCGSARRALLDDPRVPYSLHVTDIAKEAKAHFHRATTETYLILECASNAYIELNGQPFPVKPLSAVVVPPGVRHRAVGEMKVAIIATPKFDPSDECLDGSD